MNKKQQKGFGIIGVLLVIVLLAVIGGAGWYAYNKYGLKTNVNVGVKPINNLNLNANVNANINANANVSVDTSNWQTFTNNNYHYQLSYPENWFYLPKAMSGPPAPASAFFANVQETASQNYASLDIIVSELSGETLETWAEITSLENDGYTKTSVTVDGQAAKRLERRTLASDNGATLYVAKDNYMYRLTWGATSQDVYTNNSAILEAIVKSFKFIPSLVPDFTQAGTLSKPAESTSWYILWEQPGNPAVNRELVFDQQNILSRCLSGASQGNCTDFLANGLMQAGDRITVEGITNSNNQSQIFILKITKL